MNESYYISERTSYDAPVAHIEADIFYLPFNVQQENGSYQFDEYRIDMTKEIQSIPTEIIVHMVENLNYYQKALEQLGEKLNEIPEKLGYKWKPTYTGSGNFCYELVEDENAAGTQKNPIQFEPGMIVKEFFWYTDGTDLYVGIKNGVPDSIQDTEYLEKM